MNLSVYEHALDMWSNADFVSLQKELDTNVLEVKDKEQSSLESRKALATETKRFKKLESDEKLSQVNKIIKQYQQEIDNLTKRSKFSEQILFSIYAKLSEAPDPKPLIQNSLSRLSKIDDSKELKEKVEDLEDKLTKYADYESLKSRLLDLEQNAAITLSKRLAAKEQEITSIWEEKQRNWKQREAELTKQVDTVQENNKMLEAKISKQLDIDSHETSPDASNKDSTDSKYNASPEQVLLLQELQSSQSRVYQLEKRNEELSGLLAKASNSAEKESELHSKDVKISQIESENILLSASLEKEHSNLSKKQSEFDESMKNVKNELESYKSELQALRMKLNNYSDYERLKSELSALKKIEFGADDSDKDEDNIPKEDITNGNDKIESTLLSANKKLQANLADLRSKHSSEKERTKELEKELAKSQKKIQELQRLNTNLELDLEKIEDVDQSFNDTASMMSGATRQMNNRAGNSGRFSPTSSIIGIQEDSELQTSNRSVILPIITKQRDRFRSRNTELERQVRDSMTERNKLNAELSKLKMDNNKLYEKVRYLSSYNNLSSAGQAASSMNDVDSEALYSNIYDESLHPLANFRQNELEYYKKRRLPVWEKLFVSFANIILQNNTTRMVFLFYCIGLHGLVFMMSMYVINLTGYVTPEIGTVKSSTAASAAKLGAHAANLAGADALADAVPGIHI
ncbi:hypothetical protein KAFR_0G00320 [Kazachstania africana CBS 2517]|uniref:Protein CASP n=1 Tax=Kazachstania africana (strain ATCC 22294 / BCRC 22015 / CBS 2517 / CECT 1963 / NBRC 1671 / NRRL Y-8276) TaxID=1071382 RepID=H2AXG5_KAZAF|nr:hypothetical protein KAFR_0G00320 [Kazachstania africana CBS 2517]CCF59065.1 hypothetical protein KAFR_0G00320 [Kazachstania africana CBS 2517]